MIIEQESSEEKMRFLIIGAHPDDCDISAGLTAIVLRNSSHEVYSIVVTNGEKKMGRSRIEEMESARKIIGYNDMFKLGFPDTQVMFHHNDLVAKLTEIGNQINPNTIIYHSESDTHQDHVAVNRAATIAFRNGPNRLLMGSPSSKVDFAPHVFFSTTNVLFAYRKLQALQNYGSQSDIISPYSEFCKLISNGRIIRTQQHLIHDPEKFNETLNSLSEMNPLKLVGEPEFIRSMYYHKLKSEHPLGTVYAETFSPNCINYRF